MKANPADVLLVGIAAPSAPFEVILSSPSTAGGSPYVRCAKLDENSKPPCVPILQQSCQNPDNPVFFGDPAVRLNTVIGAAHAHKISSICDGDYSVPMIDMASAIVERLKRG